MRMFHARCRRHELLSILFIASQCHTHVLDTMGIDTIGKESSAVSEDQPKTNSWEALESLIDTGDAAQVQAFLQSLPVGETAHTIVRMEPAKQTRLLELLPSDTAADLMESLSDAQAADMIELLPSDRAAAIVDQMVSDEQADLLSEMHKDDAEAIIQQMSLEEAQDVRYLSKYGPDTAGGVMVTEYLAYPQHLKVDDVIQDLRSNAKKYVSYDVQYIYIVGEVAGQLLGTVQLREMILAAGSAQITSLMLPQPHSVQVTADLDAMEDFFDRHDLYGAPVIDEQGRLVGVVRRADVEESIAERADKAMLRIGGIVGGEELRSMPLLSRAARRLAFLTPNIGLNLIAVSVIAWYEPILVKVSALMIFLPILSDMGGCSGSQAVAVSMRELSLGLVKPFEVLHVLAKEAAVGVINGLVLGLILGSIAWLMRGDVYPYLGLVVGLTMAVNSLVAVCLGGSLPLLLKTIGIDPALASGPLLTLPQVADMLAIPEGRAYELARQGKLPSLRIGKYVRVSGEQLAEFQRRQALGDAT